MPSAFSWLHFDESDRQHAMQVIDLFREKGTVDELGFSPIRDAFADHLFPGTSTIQTRARYFLFIPWIMQGLTKRGRSASQIAEKIRRREARLIDALLAGDPDEPGIIGREAKSTLRRFPSSAYWRGLYLWGIRQFPGSIEQYQRRLARASGPSQESEVLTDDNEPLTSRSPDWHPALPKPPENLKVTATFRLSPEEAEFLRDRICTCQRESVLAQVLQCATSRIEADRVWDASIEAMLPPDLKAAVNHGRLFSLCARGAPLLYAAMLADMKGSGESAADIETRLLEWQSELQIARQELQSWNREAFWSLVLMMNPRITQRTRAFADAWINIATRAADGQAVWDDSAVQRLIYDRESQLKGALARLLPENHRARDRWQRDVSDAGMDYRWGPAKIVLNDIIEGLHGAPRGNDAHA